MLQKPWLNLEVPMQPTPFMVQAHGPYKYKGKGGQKLQGRLGPSKPKLSQKLQPFNVRGLPATLSAKGLS